MIFKVQKRRVLPPLQLDQPVTAPPLRPEPPLPPIGRMVRTAARELGRTIVHAAQTGRVLVEPEERARRQAICTRCEYYRTSDGRCGHPQCGCKLALKAAIDCMRCPAKPPRW